MRVVTNLGILLIIISFCSMSEDGIRISGVDAHKQVKNLTGIPFIQNYTPDDFGRYAQYWAILQLPGGEMVFGTHRGLNIYNGHLWRFIRVPGDNVYSVDQGMDGNLYFGGTNELGYVTVDSSEKFTDRSLKSHIPERYLDFTRVWQTITAGDGIYFRSTEYLFYWDYEKMYVWEPDTRFNFLAYVHNRIFVWQENRGLYELKEKTLTLLAGGDMFAEHFVRAILPYDDKRILVGTRTDGFYLFDGLSFSRWETNGQIYITNNVLYNASVLPDGSFVFATLQGGVVQIERNGNVRYIFDRDAGLQDQSVLYTYVDRNGSLWLGLQNGLSRIEPILPITKFDERNGINDLIINFKEHRGAIYAGTISGVYKLDSLNVVPQGFGVFTKVRGINAGARSFTVSGDDLLAATDDGIYKIEGDRATMVYPGMALKVLTSRYDNQIVFVAKLNHIMLGRYHRGQFSVLSESDRIPNPTSLAENDDGSLYVGTRTAGVYRLQWKDQLTSNGERNFTLNQVVRIEFPQGWQTPEETKVCYIEGEVRVGTFRGLYKIPDDYSVLLPDSLLSEAFAGGGNDVDVIVGNKKGELYFRSHSDHVIARPADNGSFSLEQGVLSRITITQFQALSIDAYDNVWFGGAEGIYRYDPNSSYMHTRELQAKISEVYVNADSLIYRGVFGRNSDNNLWLLPYTENNLRFRFFIPAYEDVSLNRYQTKLKPPDDEWSRWTDETFKDYTNLREGKYRLMVRGRDVYGNVSNAAVFEFRILPPWYRTWWSYGVSALCGLILLLTIHNFRVNRILEIERTRTRIARDLHDDIGSSLSSIALMIDMLTNRRTIPVKDKTELLNISGTARDMVDSLRDVVWVINPEHDKFVTLIERMKSTAGNMLYDIDYTFDTEVNSMNEKVTMDFKRSVLLIYKEALNNIIKHSQAKNVKINVKETDGRFLMSIEDDGVGFDKTQSTDGNGLQNMQYRAQQINGALTIETKSGAGTKIELQAELM